MGGATAGPADAAAGGGRGMGAAAAGPAADADAVGAAGRATGSAVGTRPLKLYARHSNTSGGATALPFMRLRIRLEEEGSMRRHKL